MKQWMPATMRWNLCVAVLALSGLGVPPSAVGQTSNSATSSQNPDLTVSVSLSAFTARVGDTVTETQSVTNNTAGDLFVTAVTTLTYPNGKTASRTEQFPLVAGDVATQSLTYTIDKSYQKGTYTLTLTANDGGATPSTASVRLAVTK